MNQAHEYPEFQMSPTVCCVMLVNGRAEMVNRAIASYKAQTYVAKSLLILDSGKKPVKRTPRCEYNATTAWMPDMNGATIGALRNAANWCAVDHFNANLIAHFDSDDWSHSRRLEEQVALLQASGKQCVGYRELLFWDTRHVAQCTHAGVVSRDECPYCENLGEAWIYRNHEPRWCAGASMLYTREVWEACPFDDAPHEDQRWWLTPEVSNNCVGISSIDPTKVEEFQCGGAIMRDAWGGTEPRMICQMHSGGTEQIPREVMLRGDVWARASQFDVFCNGVMKL